MPKRIWILQVVRGKNMAWYFVVDTYMDEHKGRGEYETYIQQVKPIVESYGGTYLVRTENIVSLSQRRQPQRVIVIRFENREQVDICFASPESQAIMAKRQNSVDSRAILVEGL